MKKICPVCNLREAVQNHHLCYDPEITMPICLECHNSIHPTHGVGRPKGFKIKQPKTPEEEYVSDRRTLFELNDWVWDEDEEKHSINLFTKVHDRAKTGSYTM